MVTFFEFFELYEAEVPQPPPNPPGKPQQTPKVLSSEDPNEKLAAWQRKRGQFQGPREDRPKTPKGPTAFTTLAQRNPHLSGIITAIVATTEKNPQQSFQIISFAMKNGFKVQDVLAAVSMLERQQYLTIEKDHPGDPLGPNSMFKHNSPERENQVANSLWTKGSTDKQIADLAAKYRDVPIKQVYDLLTKFNGKSIPIEQLLDDPLILQTFGPSVARQAALLKNIKSQDPASLHPNIQQKLPELENSVGLVHTKILRALQAISTEVQPRPVEINQDKTMSIDLGQQGGAVPTGVKGGPAAKALFTQPQNPRTGAEHSRSMFGVPEDPSKPRPNPAGGLGLTAQQKKAEGPKQQQELQRAQQAAQQMAKNPKPAVNPTEEAIHGIVAAANEFNNYLPKWLGKVNEFKKAADDLMQQYVSTSDEEAKEGYEKHQEYFERLGQALIKRRLDLVNKVKALSNSDVPPEIKDKLQALVGHVTDTYKEAMSKIQPYIK